MLLTLLLAAAVAGPQTLQLPSHPGCPGHWEAVQGRSLKPGLYFRTELPHVTVLDANGEKIGETGDNGGVFHCVNPSDPDGNPDDGNDI